VIDAIQKKASHMPNQAVYRNSHMVSWLRASTQPNCENSIVARFHNSV
jgi:hypothetical protein